MVEIVLGFGRPRSHSKLGTLPPHISRIIDLGMFWPAKSVKQRAYGSKSRKQRTCGRVLHRLRFVIRTACAGTIMSELFLGRKVRCHKVAVEIPLGGIVPPPTVPPLRKGRARMGNSPCHPPFEPREGWGSLTPGSACRNTLLGQPPSLMASASRKIPTLCDFLPASRVKDQRGNWDVLKS